jgi:hypothetical protein
MPTDPATPAAQVRELLEKWLDPCEPNDDAVQALLAWHTARVAEAVAREREACALLARECVCTDGPTDCRHALGNAAARAIAAMIRQRGAGDSQPARGRGR